MSFTCKIVGSREPCRTGPHNSRLLAGFISELFFLLPCIAALVHSSSLNGPNSNGFSKLLVSTHLFARSKTGVCAYRGKRQLFTQNRYGLVKFPVFHSADIPGHVHSGRTGFRAPGYNQIFYRNAFFKHRFVPPILIEML